MYLFGGSCQACQNNQAVLWNDHVNYYSTCLGGKIKKKKENSRQFSSFFVEWGFQAMNKALRCPAWSCAPHTSCTRPVWLAPALRNVTLGQRAARQTPSHSSKDMLLSRRRHIMAVGMALVQSQWSMSHESSPVPS